jgi:hypothetical protein
MKNTSLTKSLPALLALTGGAVATTAGEVQAANTTGQPQPRLDALETRIKNVQAKLGRLLEREKVVNTSSFCGLLPSASTRPC